MVDNPTPDPADHPDPAGEPRTGYVPDGIREFDHPLPSWWKWLFIATILIGFPIYGYYHFGGPNRNLIERYEVALAANSRRMFAGMEDLSDDPESLVRAMAKPSFVSIGRSVFKANCVSCHGQQGGGLVGPNLTDDVYKNVQELPDIVRVVRQGAAAGAMPSWQARLDPNEIILVSAYVASLRGTTPAGSAKGPEGDPIDPWPTMEDFPEPTAEPAQDDGTDPGAAADGAGGPENAPGQEPTADQPPPAATPSAPAETPNAIGRPAAAEPASATGRTQ